MIGQTLRVGALRFEPRRRPARCPSSWPARPWRSRPSLIDLAAERGAAGQGDRQPDRRHRPHRQEARQRRLRRPRPGRGGRGEPRPPRRRRTGQGAAGGDPGAAGNGRLRARDGRRRAGFGRCWVGSGFSRAGVWRWMGRSSVGPAGRGQAFGGSWQALGRFLAGPKGLKTQPYRDEDRLALCITWSFYCDNLARPAVGDSTRPGWRHMNAQRSFFAAARQPRKGLLQNRRRSPRPRSPHNEKEPANYFILQLIQSRQKAANLQSLADAILRWHGGTSGRWPVGSRNRCSLRRKGRPHSIRPPRQSETGEPGNF